VLLLGLLLSAAAIIAVGVFWVRLKPYYLIYLLPMFLVLLVAGGTGMPDPGEGGPRRPVRRLGKSAAAVLLMLSFWAYGVDSVWALVHFNSDDSHDHYRRLAHQVLSSGVPDLVVGDPECLHTILLYYLMPEPLQMYRTCRWAASPAVSCSWKGRRLVMLTQMTTLTDGWEPNSVRRFREFRREGLWFVYTHRFENQPLLDVLQAECQAQGQWDHLDLFWCAAADGRH
jgi:hypothetical protein